MSKNITKPFGFIYITTNLINGKQYIGQCSLSRSCWRSYLGSGKALKRAIKKYGREKFERVILCHCFSKDDMNIIEEQIIADYDAVGSRNFYNIIAKSTATGGFLGKGHTEEWKQARAEFGKTRVVTDRMRENMRMVGKLPRTRKQLAQSALQAKKMGLRNAKPKILKEHLCPVCKGYFEVLEYEHHVLDITRVCGAKCGAVVALKSRKNVKRVKIEGMVFDNAKEASRELNVSYDKIRRRLISDKFDEYMYVGCEENV